MLKVRFELQYKFDGARAKRCWCLMRILLPAEENKMLHRHLRSRNVRVAEYPLHEWWGTDFDSGLWMRVWRRELCADSWEELEQKVQSLIDETVKTLREVKERNLEFERTMPEPRVVEVEI